MTVNRMKEAAKETEERNTEKELLLLSERIASDSAGGVKLESLIHEAMGGKESFRPRKVISFFERLQGEEPAGNPKGRYNLAVYPLQLTFSVDGGWRSWQFDLIEVAKIGLYDGNYAEDPILNEGPKKIYGIFSSWDSFVNLESERNIDLDENEAKPAGNEGDNFEMGEVIHPPRLISGTLFRRNALKEQAPHIKKVSHPAFEGFCGFLATGNRDIFGDAAFEQLGEAFFPEPLTAIENHILRLRKEALFFTQFVHRRDRHGFAHDATWGEALEVARETFGGVTDFNLTSNDESDDVLERHFSPDLDRKGRAMRPRNVLNDRIRIHYGDTLELNIKPTSSYTPTDEGNFLKVFFTVDVIGAHFVPKMVEYFENNGASIEARRLENETRTNLLSTSAFWNLPAIESYTDMVFYSWYPPIMKLFVDMGLPLEDESQQLELLFCTNDVPDKHLERGASMEMVQPVVSLVCLVVDDEF